jgi:hypothetical protein
MARSLHARLASLREQLRAAAPEAFAEPEGPPVVLPPFAVFRTLPPDEQYRLLRDYRPPRRPIPKPIDLAAFERLPLKERICVIHEAAGPPDENMMACSRCLTLQEQLRLLRDLTARSGGPPGRMP